eukprot:GHVL01015103.1.p1 GENE.GHVL01015103.1~~GHVL01015103.1.p1  ORF type:complete len:284 (+),score=51.27 GHVL01015103.1:23-874(+)
MKIKIFVYGGGFGNGLSTVLTSKSRLTVQNEPLITYPIQSLVHCGTTEITVFIRKSDFEEVSKILLSKFKNTKFEFCETDDSWGSAQCLRHYFETHKIQETDILLVSGDYIGPLDIDSLLLTHRQNNACLTVLLSEKNENEDYDDGDLVHVGVAVNPINSDDRQLTSWTYHTLVSGGSRIRVSQAMLQQHWGGCTIRPLLDLHVYLISTLSARLILNTDIVSIKEELVPALVNRQHLQVSKQWERKRVVFDGFDKSRTDGRVSHFFVPPPGVITPQGVITPGV